MSDLERIEQAVSDVIGDRCWSPVAQRWVTATAVARYIADALTPKPHEMCEHGKTEPHNAEIGSGCESRKVYRCPGPSK